MKKSTKWNLGVAASVVLFTGTIVGALILTAPHAKHRTTFVTPTPTVSTSPTPTTDPSPSKYYAASQLWMALTNKGFACDGFKSIDKPQNNSISMGGCDNFAVVISIYANEDDTQEAPTDLYSLSDGTEPVYMVLGPNWSVNCDDLNMASMVEQDLGGDLIRIEVSK
jgi:hypothetical protein